MALLSLKAKGIILYSKNMPKNPSDGEDGWLLSSNKEAQAQRLDAVDPALGIHDPLGGKEVAKGLNQRGWGSAARHLGP